ncbi:MULTISPECIES: protein-methionine-sulfoxide reductase heme-binding subunit MsrQ [Rahnella]|jgi:sulfoxide reductase heme-binding subunit YedZ|uniref:Protein-methionine-sulfoxide reductase heme-binding subunit MsrQ n=1 Tax=Rahnella sp. (strain Y9602) TaxID=2703885 RepID=A0A0H3FHB7_RAHSY|nr:MULTISPECIES: protein-methionine-sulfoxide reductase heme-binding subunit MsrQ [Rahnella]AFE60292.1 putative sulfite oxidase subunit YedZ [Rahnella aquatilis HX2]AYA08881.1 protein-methionine-sulfoxide reductase heme-binding subunit MsrQ [Rahnella aquatilis]ADW75605.1 Ferric reductase domain protein transmembrane component domain protein [Rahnella aceris]AZP52812.1 protein-methionine-sulfoxide reductase heme-binding subunit MsrQ [Rahnella aquatilis]MBU9851293.1 protein-methionine-sulfoxide 
MRRLSPANITGLKVIIYLCAILPFFWIVLSINQGGFSADPAKDIQHFTGRMTLKFLLVTLLVTPVARYGKQPLLIRTRRLLGLWCFAWGTLHLLSYSFLELGINNIRLLGSELISRPYLTLGIICWILLLALACTSTVWAQRKMGSTWQKLHNFIYLIAILAPIHYLWSVKVLSPQPVIYAILAVILLAFRYKKFRQWLR